MQNKLRRSEAYLLNSAYRKVSASNAVFCASKVRIKCCWTKGLPLEDWCLHRCLLVVSMLVYRVQQPPNTYRCSQAIKAHDFDSCIRWFEFTQRCHMRWQFNWQNNSLQNYSFSIIARPACQHRTDGHGCKPSQLTLLRGLVRYINKYGPISRWYNLHLLFLSFDFYKNL